MARTVKSAEESNKKWEQNTVAGVPFYQQGIQRVTESPTEKAASQVQKMRTNINAALDSGKWERSLRAVSLPDWRKAAMETGAQRIASGVAKSSGKQLEMMKRLLPTVQEALNQVDAMPSTTFQDRMGRMVAYATYMHQHPIK